MFCQGSMVSTVPVSTRLTVDVEDIERDHGNVRSPRMCLCERSAEV